MLGSAILRKFSLSDILKEEGVDAISIANTTKKTTEGFLGRKIKLLFPEEGDIVIFYRFWNL